MTWKNSVDQNGLDAPDSFRKLFVSLVHGHLWCNWDVLDHLVGVDGDSSNDIVPEWTFAVGSSVSAECSAAAGADAVACVGSSVGESVRSIGACAGRGDRARSRLPLVSAGGGVSARVSAGACAGVPGAGVIGAGVEGLGVLNPSGGPRGVPGTFR